MKVGVVSGVCFRNPVSPWVLNHARVCGSLTDVVSGARGKDAGPQGPVWRGLGCEPGPCVGAVWGDAFPPPADRQEARAGEQGRRHSGFRCVACGGCSR